MTLDEELERGLDDRAIVLVARREGGAVVVVVLDEVGARQREHAGPAGVRALVAPSLASARALGVRRRHVGVARCSSASRFSASLRPLRGAYGDPDPDSAPRVWMLWRRRTVLRRGSCSGGHDGSAMSSRLSQGVTLDP